ncbi:hypothetical protein [Desulfopila sp. IMCC35008]|uniref:hypothetical protein n=1 Tax=Desulfopila sp. IMCC35008 TaxID=2653858 RepID=UPI0013D02902|nr:hypothetical protein [Desulfopila sp. IMCC35008]
MAGYIYCHNTARTVRHGGAFGECEPLKMPGKEGGEKRDYCFPVCGFWPEIGRVIRDKRLN